jgi:hypothetical protein
VTFGRLGGALAVGNWFGAGKRAFLFDRRSHFEPAFVNMIELSCNSKQSSSI